MGKWCLHASSFIFDRIIIKVAGNQDRHKSSDEFDFGPLVSMAHLYVFLNEIWPWHIGLRWATVALWATCYRCECLGNIWNILWRIYKPCNPLHGDSNHQIPSLGIKTIRFPSMRIQTIEFPAWGFKTLNTLHGNSKHRDSNHQIPSMVIWPGSLKTH